MQHGSNGFALAGLAFIGSELAAGIEFGAVNSPFLIQVHNSDISNAALLQGATGQMEDLSRLAAHLADNSLQVKNTSVVQIGQHNA